MSRRMRGGPGGAKGDRDGEPGERSAGNLQATHPQEIATHAEQQRQREFQPDGKEQEHDAELSQELDEVVEGQPAEAVGSNDESDAEVTQNRR